MSWRWMIVAASLATLFSLPAVAQAPRLSVQERQASDEHAAMVEFRSRESIEQLFARLCPGRCELVELGVEMSEPNNVGAVAPGFEAVTPGAYDVKPKSIGVTILLDSKLPRSFQSNIPRMIQYRLRELAPVVDVRPEVLNFPEPQLAPMPPMMAEPPRQRRQAPLPVETLEKPAEEVAPPVEPVEAPVVKELTWWDRLAPFLAQIAPWIGPILMMLVMFALMLMLIRRLGELNRPVSASAQAETKKKRPEIDVDALQAELNASRAVRNAVLRSWLAEDEEGVAHLVRLMGPEILSDLKSDESLSGKLAVVSRLVASHKEPLDSEEIQRVAHETQARLTAARIMHDEQGLAMEWEFLEGMGVANLRRIMRTCTSAEKVYVVGLLPSALRSSFLEKLDQNERRELFLGTNSEVLSKQEAIALAARLRRAAESVAHIGKEADGQALLVIDMLRAMSIADQEDMLRELKSKRPEVAQAVLGRVVLETTLLGVPGELLADAIHRSPVDTLASFLRGARADVRDHVLSHAPGTKRQAIYTELSLDVPVGKSEFLMARDTFLDAVAVVLRREDHDLVRANARTIMNANNINPISNEVS